MIIDRADIIHICLAGLFIAIIYSILRILADANKDLKLQIRHLNNTILEHKERLYLSKKRYYRETGQLIKLDELEKAKKND